MLTESFNDSVQNVFEARVAAYQDPPSFLEMCAIPENTMVPQIDQATGQPIVDEKGNAVVKTRKNYEYRGAKTVNGKKVFEFRVFALVEGDGTETDLDTELDAADSVFKAGNPMDAAELSLGTEDFFFKTVYKDAQQWSKLDEQFSQITSVSDLVYTKYLKGRRRFIEVMIARQLLRANIWINNGAADPVYVTVTADTAITDTTFDVVNADRAKLTAGDFVKFDKPLTTVVAGEQFQETIVMIKTVGANDSGTAAGDALITIESDVADIPTNTFGYKIYKDVVSLVMPAIDVSDAAAVKFGYPDTPNTVTPATSFDQMENIRVSMAERNVPESGLMSFMPHRLWTLFRRIGAPISADYVAGSKFFQDGRLDTADGIPAYRSNYALDRMVAGVRRMYIVAFHKGAAYIVPKLFSTSSVDKQLNQGGAVTVASWVEITGAHAPHYGRRKMSLTPCEKG